MSEKPILFSAPMVKAILDGRKTQTRRIVKPQPKMSDDGKVDWIIKGQWCGAWTLGKGGNMTCPYGAIGTHLWVRETWCEDNGRIIYKADFPTADGSTGATFKWKPSIFMPRVASRITLEVKNIRVERLQDITDSDAIREGIPDYPDFVGECPVDDFRELWSKINGEKSWNENPFVWVVEFTKL